MEEGISCTVFKNKNTKENFIYLQNSFGKKFRNCWKINCVLMIVLYSHILMIGSPHGSHVNQCS